MHLWIMYEHIHETCYDVIKNMMSWSHRGLVFINGDHFVNILSFYMGMYIKHRPKSAQKCHDW